MGSITKLPLLKTLQENNVTTTQLQPIMHNSNSDFPIAIAVLAILAIAFLLVSYYIFVIKCCLNWQNLDPLRRFSISRARRNDDPLMAFSPMVDMHRGLDEWLINNIPAFQYKPENRNNEVIGDRSFRGCAVCLNEFHEQEMLRVLPRCSHIFHLDCIDVWLLNNASCPLCRSSISGRTKYPIDQIIAPSSSPQEFSPFSGSLSVNVNGDDQDYLVIELGREERERSHESTEQKGRNVIGSCKKSRKFQNLSIMGDECINVRKKDEQFEIEQPIRRSFSMDSAADRGLYLQVQEVIRQSRHVNNNEVSNGRDRRSSFFSFGHGRGSRSSSILPIEFNDR